MGSPTLKPGARVPIYNIFAQSCGFSRRRRFRLLDLSLVVLTWPAAQLVVALMSTLEGLPLQT